MDEHLNFNSSSFDPLEALKGKSVTPPVPNARPHDHISQCRKYLPSSHPLSLKGDDVRPAPAHSEPKGHLKNSERRTGASSRRQTRCNDPVRNMMEKLKDGPFGMLLECIQNKHRVHVITRHIKGVRGWAEGNLLAFDKHMNLVLRDVQETYQVRIMVEKMNKDGSTKWRPVLERRQRKLPSVLLMGSSIVSISKAAIATP